MDLDTSEDLRREDFDEWHSIAAACLLHQLRLQAEELGLHSGEEEREIYLGMSDHLQQMYRSTVTRAGIDTGWIIVGNDDARAFSLPLVAVTSGQPDSHSEAKDRLKQNLSLATIAVWNGAEDTRSGIFAAMFAYLGETLEALRASIPATKTEEDAE